MHEALLSYFKGLFGLLPRERIYYYFNPEGDFQDIKGLMPLEDNTMVPFLIVGIVLLFFAGWMIRFVIKTIQTKRALSRKNIAKKKLMALDTNDAKMCAYQLTRWGHYLVTKRNNMLHESLEKELFKYKYKKGTTSLKEEEKKALSLFLKDSHG